MTVDVSSDDKWHALGDPELKCYHARRAARDVHAVSISDRPGARALHPDRLRIHSATRTVRMNWKGEAPADSVDGLVARPLGGRHAGCRRDRAQRTRRGSTGPEIFTATPFTWSNATRRSVRYHLMYEATIDDPKVFTRPWKISLPLYRRVEKKVQLLEFKCVPFSEELLFGRFGKPSAK